MYGLVNKGIKDLVIRDFGVDKWEAIRKDANVLVNDFAPLDTFSDDITYQLINSACKILNLSPEALLTAFGRFWVLFTADEGYGNIMALFGNDLATCFKNLNNIHSRMGSMLPKLKPPRFVVKILDSKKYSVEYHSIREGLAPMVFGLLEGLAHKFNTKVRVTQEKKKEGQTFELFLVEEIA